MIGAYSRSSTIFSILISYLTRWEGWQGDRVAGFKPVCNLSRICDLPRRGLIGKINRLVLAGNMPTTADYNKGWGKREKGWVFTYHDDSRAANVPGRLSDIKRNNAKGKRQSGQLRRSFIQFCHWSASMIDFKVAIIESTEGAFGCLRFVKIR